MDLFIKYILIKKKMLFAIDYNKTLKNINYYVNLNYYRYFTPLKI